MKQRILITGGAGFIGSNIALHLLKKNNHVTILDNVSRFGVKKNLENLQKQFGKKILNVLVEDIRDKVGVQKAVGKADVVYHMAGQVAVTTSFLNPRYDFEVNALGTLNVLEGARKSGHKPIIIYASTNKVYGDMKDVAIVEKKTRYDYKTIKGISEKHPLSFHSPYGCSKGVGDQYVQDYYRMYDIPTVVFRQSCIYGPNQMGIEDQGWVAYLAAAAHLQKPITVYGDGKQVRDLLHVADLITAYEKAISHIRKTKGEAFNIGGGRAYSFSLQEYLLFLEKYHGKKLTIRKAAWRPGDQKVYLSDTAKLQNLLGWKAKISHTEGLSQLSDWIIRNAEAFAPLFRKR